MKTLTKGYRAVAILVLVTALLLLVPLVAMQFTPEVNWSIADFLVMGTLIFGTGLTFILLIRMTPGIVYRIAVAAGLGTTFLMIWANLAVGLIGSGPHAGNLMYMAVVFVVATGSIWARFRPQGMERTMYAATLSLAVLAAIALIAGMQHYPGSSVTEIMAVNGFFAGLYCVAGALFRYAAKQTLPQRA